MIPIRSVVIQGYKRATLLALTLDAFLPQVSPHSIPISERGTHAVQTSSRWALTRDRGAPPEALKNSHSQSGIIE